MTLKTSLERLKTLKVKADKASQSHLERWCDALVCGCMGCANKSAAVGFNDRTEWQDFLSWRNAGYPEHTNVESINPFANLSKKDGDSILSNATTKLFLKDSV